MIRFVCARGSFHDPRLSPAPRRQVAGSHHAKGGQAVTEYKIVVGDCREVLARMQGNRIHTVVTSPPYWGLRDYGVEGQLGLEPSYTEYVGKIVTVFREVRRVIRDDGTVWLNLGD